MSLGGGGGQQELQELAQQLEAIEEQQAAIEAEIEGLQTRKREVDEAIEAIENLETGSTVQVPLGGGAYVRAEISDIDEVIVDLGADYSAERDQEGAVSSLESKQDTLDERIEDLRSEITEIEAETDKLEERAQELQTQQLQQMQQMQQQQDDE
jgi:prefoldin alpha subunit